MNQKLVYLKLNNLDIKVWVNINASEAILTIQVTYS